MKYSRITLFLLVPLLVFGLYVQSARADVLMGAAVDNWDIEWYYSSSTRLSFYGQTTTYYYGGSSAQSGAIYDDEQSLFYGYTPYCPAGSSVRFVWKVSSEAGYDILSFKIDSTEMASISGEVGWQTRTFSLSAGYHTFWWYYTKDRSVSSGADAGWVDKVQIVTGYTVDIWAWCASESQGWISRPITMDGVSTGYSTPHTFADLTGTHTFTVPSTDALGHTFYEWNTGSTSRTLTVSSAGQYTARYRQGTSTLTVTTPNGGQKWIRGTTHTITWSSTGSPGANVKIELLKGGVVNRVITSSTANDGSYSWTISSTQTLGTDYKIRITSTSNTAITDSSNSNFAVVAGTLTVTTPNGGNSWKRGTVHTITWTKSGSPGSYVKIELLKGGVVSRVITSSTLNDGSYSWTISSTQTTGTDYKIRITSTTYSSITDSSNSNFAITA
jgi:5-hydroxyisourate hydrolase-like protein (transthyretin family)